MTIVEQVPKEPPALPPFGYAFAGVTLELARGRLLVDGRDTGAGPLTLKLLVVLCQSPGLLVTRTRLFDEVWPRQAVSDEALTKLIARLRETLGPYGKSLVTLRGRGVRLDAAVVELQETPSMAPAGPELSAFAPQALATTTARDAEVVGSMAGRVLWSARIAVALTLMLMAWLATRLISGHAPTDPAEPVFAGYGITMADMAGGKPETLELLRGAETALDDGQSEHMLTVLQVAHESDRGTPVPGLLLEILRWHGQHERDRKLDEEIAARLGEGSTPYVRLLARLASDMYMRPDGGEPALAALTAMRPSAWRFQLGLAHRMLAQRRNASALVSLKQVPDKGIPATISMMALADRASLGDEDAVTRLLSDGALADEPAARAYVLGRLEWTRNHVDAAIAHLDEAANLSDRNNNFWLEIVAREHGALFAFHANRPDALARLERTMGLIRRTTIRQNRIVELLPLAAERYLEDGRPEQATGVLRDVAQQELTGEQRAALEIFNARLGFVLPEGDFLSADQGQTLQTEDNTGLVELARAWAAYARSDEGAARHELEQARTLGVDETYFREDAAALDALLSRRSSSCRPDPPFPNLLRFSTCRTLLRGEKSRSR